MTVDEVMGVVASMAPGELTERNSHGDDDGNVAPTYLHSFDTGSKICLSYDTHGSLDASMMSLRSLMHLCRPMSRICRGRSLGRGRNDKE